MFEARWEDTLLKIMCRWFFNDCGGPSLWSDCIHESEDQAFGNAIVEKQNYQYETSAKQWERKQED